MYEGVLIKESLLNEDILDFVEIKNAEIWIAENHSSHQPRYWTAVTFASAIESFPSLLSQVVGGSWYVNMRDASGKMFIVLKDQVICYPIGDETARKAAQAACLQAGIPDTQLDWAE